MNRLGDGAGNSNAPDISDTKIKIFMILKLKIKNYFDKYAYTRSLVRYI